MMRASVFLGAIVASITVGAHHSPNVHFDRGEVVEISGRITEIEWQNPHTVLTIETTGEGGAMWSVETKAASQLQRADLTPEIFHVGDEVRVAGFRGRRNRTAMFVTNFLLADGRELIAENLAGPRWTDDVAGVALEDYQAARIQASTTSSQTLFKVWSREGFTGGIQGTERMLWLDSYPLTEWARSVQEGWNPESPTDNPFIHCQSGMPAIMDQGFPLEFVQEGDRVVLHLEELDSVRTIHMGADDAASNANEPAGPFGRSVGHWEDETLVVHTTDIEWAWFDQSGIPQSDALELVERFTPSADGRVLRYELTATDPAVFTEPVVLTRRWIWVPGEERKPYDCTWEEEL